MRSTNLATYICKRSGIAVLASPNISTPYADLQYKIIYLPVHMADLNSPRNVGILLHEAGHLEYTDILDQPTLMRLAAKTGIGQPALTHIFETIYNCCEDMRVESKLIDRYLGAYQYIETLYDDFYLPILPAAETKEQLAMMTLKYIMQERFFPVDKAKLKKLPRKNQAFFKMVTDLLPEIEKQTSNLDMLQMMFEQGIIEKFLEIWPPPKGTPESAFKQFLQDLLELLKSHRDKLQKKRQTATAQTVAAKAGDMEAETIEDGQGADDEDTTPGRSRRKGNGLKKQKEEVEARTELAERVKPYVPELVRTLKKIKAHGYTKTLPNQRRGNINTKHLVKLIASDSDKIFKRKHRVKTTSKAAITLVLDSSGSMVGNRVEQAISSTYLIASALEQIKRPVRITHFHDYVEKVKDWNDSQWSTELLSIEGGGGNMDGDAVQDAIKGLKGRTEEDKVIIVLTDGGVCQPEELQAQLTLAHKAGIRVYGIAIGRDTIHETKSYYGDKFSYDAGDVSRLPKVMSQLLKDADLL